VPLPSQKKISLWVLFSKVPNSELIKILDFGAFGAKLNYRSTTISSVENLQLPAPYFLNP